VRCVINRIDNAELALANTAAPLGPGKFFTTHGSRLRGQCGDAVNDALAILLLTKRFDLLAADGLMSSLYPATLP
jgi:hypothetical protein